MKIHPFAEFLPSATNAEYRNIREDIRKHGLQVPLLVFDDMLIDGRTRLQACRDLGIKPRIQILSGNTADALAKVQSLNVFRRHLSQSQKAAVADKICDALQAMDGLTVKEARAAAVKATGAADSTTQEAATISRASPELAEEIINGEKTIEEAKRELRPTSPPLRSVRHLATAMNELQHSIRELKQRRRPETRRLKEILTELRAMLHSLTAWVEET